MYSLIYGAKYPPAPALICGEYGYLGDKAQVAFDSDCFS